MMPQVQPMESFVQAPVQYGAPQVTTAPPVYMTSPALSPSMTVQQQPAMQVGMAAPQVGYEQLQPEPSMTYSMAPQTMGEAPGMQMVAEPVATRIEPAGGMMMEQQPVPTHIEAMPATTYSAPAATYLAGAQPGVMMGGPTMMGAPVQQEGFLQHAMHSVGNALGLGGSQANTTYIQGGQVYGQGGGVTYASAPAGGVTSFGSVQTPVTYGASGAMPTTTTGGYAVGGAGSASLFDQLDTNHDGVISRAEFAQVVQQ